MACQYDQLSTVYAVVIMSMLLSVPLRKKKPNPHPTFSSTLLIDLLPGECTCCPHCALLPLCTHRRDHSGPGHQGPAGAVLQRALGLCQLPCLRHTPLYQQAHQFCTRHQVVKNSMPRFYHSTNKQIHWRTSFVLYAKILSFH